MNELLQKYAKGQSDEDWARILWLHQNKSGIIGDCWDNYSLFGVKDFYRNMLQIADFET